MCIDKKILALVRVDNPRLYINGQNILMDGGSFPGTF